MENRQPRKYSKSFISIDTKSEIRSAVEIPPAWMRHVVLLCPEPLTTEAGSPFGQNSQKTPNEIWGFLGKSTSSIWGFFGGFSKTPKKLGVFLGVFLSLGFFLRVFLGVF